MTSVQRQGTRKAKGWGNWRCQRFAGKSLIQPANALPLFFPTKLRDTGKTWF